MKAYQIEGYKRSYPPGTTVELISMEDSHAVPAGTKGIVDFVDAVGTVHVTWENGRTLGLCPDVDRFRRLEAPAVSKGADEKPSVSDRLKAAEKAAAAQPSKEKPAPSKEGSR